MEFAIKKRRVFIRSYKRRITVYILVPVLATLILYSTLNFYLLNRVSSQLLAQCKLGHSNFAYNYEQEFYSLSQTSLLLINDRTFKEMYYGQTIITPAHNYLFLDSIETLIAFAATKPYILQIGYVNNVNGRYISSAGTAGLRSYYDNSYYGTIVNRKDYLKTYEKRGSIFQIQKLDTKYRQTTIPLLQYQAGQYTLSSPLIYYVSKPYFSSKLNNYKSTGGSNLFIYSSGTNQVIASSKTSLEDDVLTELSKDFAHETGMKTITISKEKYYCIVSASKSNYTDPLLFVSLVPYKDIRSQTMNSWLLSLLILVICSVLSSLLSYLLSFKLYTPIQNIINTFSPKDTARKDIYKDDELLYLDRNIKELLHSNSSLKANITNALPSLYSRYILNILYQEEYNNKALEAILKDYSFSFPYDNFTCSILYPKFSAEFYEHFTKAEQAQIKQQLTDVLVLTQDNSCVKYVFRLEEDNFCIISNSPYEDEKELLYADFMSLQQLFSFDKDYIRLYIAMGKTCESLHNLHLSWKQANAAFSQLSAFREDNISFYEEAPIRKKNYLMDPTDDNHLTALLLQGNKESVLTLAKEIVQLNQQMHLTEEATKDLYVHLYEIGDSILRRTNETGQDLLGEKYVNISTFIHGYSNLERSDFIQLFYGKLCEGQSCAQGSSFDMENIKKYVDEHFSEDIYLESLANLFHTSPKYMSRLLKQALGIPFKQYITALRIVKSKTLLAESDYKIDDIALSVGFNNRNSFIRIFKQIEAMTPSEYRTLAKHQ